MNNICQLASRLLGRDTEHPMVKELTSQYFPYEFYMNETRGGLCLKQEDTFYTPEELIAMFMQYAKEMTHHFGGKVISKLLKHDLADFSIPLLARSSRTVS